jgi:hypothetical protein
MKMQREDLKQKRQNLINQVQQGVIKRFGPEWSADKETSAQEPERLIEFYFKSYGQSLGRYDSSELSAMMDYINLVLKKRKEDLERTLFLLRTAHCLNDINAAAHYRLLCDTLQGMVKTFESLYADVSAANIALAQAAPMPAYR